MTEVIAEAAKTPPDLYLLGSLRSKLVAKLTGLSVRTLQNWHATALQTATREPGKRGTPRYYSWVDYQRLCIVSSLREQGVPTQRIRKAIPLLDDLFPGWWELSLRAYRGRVPGSQSRTHIVVDPDDPDTDMMDVIADVPGGQMTFRDRLEDDADDVTEFVALSLRDLERKGPLFRQAAFSDAVTMNPEINAAQPTIIDTNLETYFVSELAREFGIPYVEENYRLDPARIRRAVDFEAAS